MEMETIMNFFYRVIVMIQSCYSSKKFVYTDEYLDDSFESNIVFDDI